MDKSIFPRIDFSFFPSKDISKLKEIDSKVMAAWSKKLSSKSTPWFYDVEYIYKRLRKYNGKKELLDFDFTDVVFGCGSYLSMESIYLASFIDHFFRHNSSLQWKDFVSVCNLFGNFSPFFKSVDATFEEIEAKYQTIDTEQNFQYTIEEFETFKLGVMSYMFSNKRWFCTPLINDSIFAYIQTREEAKEEMELMRDRSGEEYEDFYADILNDYNHELGVLNTIILCI